MLVATFGPSTAWQGREIIWDVDRFILVGHGAIPAAGVLDYDRRGQLVWDRPELRSWVAQVDHWEMGGRPTPGGSAGFAATSGGATPGAAPARRFPVWAIVVLAVVGVLLLVSIPVAILVPAFVRTTEKVTKDLAVESGVRSIQTGIESYAVEHGGAYPAPGEVNGTGLVRYVPAWPVNPYTDLPMCDGGGVGNFRYDVSADGGAYKLIGYGRDATVVIELSGGTWTSV
jgi:type II secretory pathway pseudopilin PulG